MTKKVHAVGLLLENKNGQILVLKRHPQDPEGTTWGLVGGKVEQGEDAKTAVIREVQEEIGYRLDPAKLQYIKSYHWDREDLDLTFEVFKLSVPQEKVTLDLAPNEHTEYLWETPEKLHSRKDLMTGLYPILADTYNLE